MVNVENIPRVEQEFKPASNGGTYVSKQVFEDAYWRVTITYDEQGRELVRDEKKRD